MKIVREFERRKLTASKVVYFEAFDPSGPEAIGRIYLDKNLLAHLTAQEDGGRGSYPEFLRVTVEDMLDVQEQEITQQNEPLSQAPPADEGAQP